MEFGAEALLIDRAGIELTGHAALGQPLGGPHQLSSAAVVGAHIEVNAGVGGGACGGIGNQPLEAFGQRLKIPQKADPHLLLLQGVELAGQHPLKQGHQKADLFARTAPVFGGEGVGGEGTDPPVAAQPQGALERLNALAMAHHPRQVALLGPAPVAIHDHGHMAGQPRRIEAGLHGLRGSHSGGRRGATHPRESGVSLATLRPVGKARAWLSRSCKRLLVIGRSSRP